MIAPIKQTDPHSEPYKIRPPMPPLYSKTTQSALRTWLREETFDSGLPNDEARFFLFAHEFSNEHKTVDDEDALRAQLLDEINALHRRTDEVGLEKCVRKWVREIQVIMAYRAALESGR